MLTLLNRILLMGRLTRDPELRRTAAGKAVANFALAVERDIPDRESRARGVDFLDVTAWGKTGEFVANHFSKGRMALVEGRLQMEEWTDRSGVCRRSPRVVADRVWFGDAPRRPEGQPQADGPDEGVRLPF